MTDRTGSGRWSAHEGHEAITSAEDIRAEGGHLLGGRRQPGERRRRLLPLHEDDVPDAAAVVRADVAAVADPDQRADGAAHDAADGDADVRPDGRALGNPDGDADAAADVHALPLAPT